MGGGGRVNKLRGIVKREGKNNMMGLDGKKEKWQNLYLSTQLMWGPPGIFPACHFSEFHS